MKLRPEDDEEIEIDMSPMIDMVFLLLIFFLVAATLLEEKVPVENIPEAINANIPDEKKDRVVVSIKDVDKIYVGPYEETPLTMEQLKQRLMVEKEKNKKISVQIRCAGDIKYRVTEKVMKACGRAGITNLIYTAYKKTTGEED